ncbi:MAG: type II toxin-antitoxin system RatA family toxin [Cardiobacteriaceae bacterium]|nr:type II toxin-antitoxin system RatA family toxin [Cardiobacteriaceae bacterium]
MPQIIKSKKLPYSPEKLFDLVADVEKYPEFLPWCGGAKLVKRDEKEIVGTLVLAKGGLRKSFTTRNICNYPNRMDIALVEGPFKSLNGHWEFKKIDEGCEVSCCLRFEIPFLLQPILGSVLEYMANTMVESFARRAAVVYPDNHEVIDIPPEK